MYSKQMYCLENRLGQILGFTFWPQYDETGELRPEAIIQCKTYARQEFESISQGYSGPFNYGLRELWLAAYQKPWAEPRQLHKLIADLAAKIASGEMFAYLEDSPHWYHPSLQRSGGGSPRPAVADGGVADTPRTQDVLPYVPHPDVEKPKAGDRIHKRVHRDGDPEDSYTLLSDDKPMGAEEGLVPLQLVGMRKPPKNHDNLVKEGWPTLTYDGGDTYRTFTAADPVELAPGEKLYRLVDEKNPDAGGFWARSLPKNKTEWRRDYAVKDSWNDDGYYVEHVVGPDGVKAWEGPAAGQQYEEFNGRELYLAGGKTQLFITPHSIDTTPPKLTHWPEI